VGTGPLLRYTVEGEHGIVLAPADVVTVGETTLADPRGWTIAGSHAYQRTDTQPDVRVLLATPATQTSCARR
jgi:hypothetical protein